MEGCKERKVMVAPATAVVLLPLLSKAKVSGVPSENLLGIIKATRAIKHIVNDFDDLRKQVAESLRDADYDSMMALVEKKDATEEDKEKVKEYVNVYNKRLLAALEPGFREKTEVVVQALPDEVFAKLVADNGWDMSQAMALQEILCQEDI